MTPILASITRISNSARRGSGLNRNSVMRRMSWIGRRIATRSEDMAYALPGILDVIMPLLHGEGSTVFVRLKEEVMGDNEDQSPFAWTALISHTVQLPYLLSVFAYHPQGFEASGSIFGRPFQQGSGEPYA